MKKFIKENKDISEDLMDRFVNSPKDIQLALQLSDKCFPSITNWEKVGPADLDGKKDYCMSFVSSNPANANYPNGYLCGDINGPLFYLTNAEKLKKDQGQQFNRSKETKWTCPVLTLWKNGLQSPNVQTITAALKDVYKENIKDYNEITPTQAFTEGWYLKSLLDIYNENKQALNSIGQPIIEQITGGRIPIYFWMKGVTVDVQKDISQEIVDFIESISAVPGQCTFTEKQGGKCFDINLNNEFPGKFQGPKYYHYYAQTAEEARTKLKNFRKETKDEYGKRDCKKVFREYIDVIKTCGQSVEGGQTGINIMKPAVQACINTQREKFPDEVKIINNPIKGKHMAMSCTKDFRLTQTESESKLKNIIRENLIKLSIRKGLI